MYVVDDAQASSSELKTEFKSTKLPLFRYYPNQKEGEAKRQASFNIVMPSEAYDTEFQQQMSAAIFESISQEIKDNYVSDVKDVTEKIYYSLANENARTGKVVVNYIYDDENGVDFTYKAVSTDPILADLFVFFATDGPSEQMKAQAESLPALVGMLPIDEENPSPRIFNF